MGFLNDSHSSLEREVKNLIASKSKEMRELEEQVRWEVEMLWGKYRDGPGRGDKSDRSRSASSSRSGGKQTVRDPIQSRAFSPPAKRNPVLVEAALSPPLPGSSLLAASLSAKAFYAPSPARVSDRGADVIADLSKKVDKRLDARAVAMSYVFLTLDDAMSSSQRRGGEVPADDPVASGKDSWIDEERRVLAMRDVSLEHEGEMMTPKQGLNEKPRETLLDKAKEKRAVKFKEPVKPRDDEDKEIAEEDVEEEEVEDAGDADGDGGSTFTLPKPEFITAPEHVFDLELDGTPSPPNSDQRGLSPPPEIQTISRTRNAVEAQLSLTFAADAPSHRAAYRKVYEGSMHDVVRRGYGRVDDEYVGEASALNMLAMSMPVDVAVTAQLLTEMERKTSLTERSGILVPPLLGAMREKGVPGLSPEMGIPKPRERSPARPIRTEVPLKKGSRSASGSRHPEGVNSYSAKPCRMFETLLDDDDEEADEEDEEVGTRRGSSQFVPPHLLARKEIQEARDVGWRSLVS